MYMIHTCPERLWYVRDYLIPSMQSQGISNIEIWNDIERKGNLQSFVDSMKECGRRAGGTWHLQDDVVISSDFAKVTKMNCHGIVCGYCNDKFGPNIALFGNVPVQFMWNSFPCIRIPNETAKAFYEWFTNDAMNDKTNRGRILQRKFDDSFFQIFVIEHYEGLVTNLKPNIVDHVDFLIGGSVINKARNHQSRAAYFDGPEVEQLENELAKRRS